MKQLPVIPLTVNLHAGAREIVDDCLLARQVYGGCCHNSFEASTLRRVSHSHSLIGNVHL